MVPNIEDPWNKDRKPWYYGSRINWISTSNQRRFLIAEYKLLFPLQDPVHCFGSLSCISLDSLSFIVGTATSQPHQSPPGTVHMAIARDQFQPSSRWSMCFCCGEFISKSEVTRHFTAYELATCYHFPIFVPFDLLKYLFLDFWRLLILTKGAGNSCYTWIRHLSFQLPGW